MGTGPDLSVVTPFGGASHTVEMMLAGLARQTLARDRWEVVLVDDGAQLDPSVLRSATTDLPLRLVSLAERRGVGAARNAGAGTAVADTLLFLDADIVAAPDLLEQHLDAHRAGPPGVILGQRYESGWETIRQASRGNGAPPASALETDMRCLLFGTADPADSRAPWMWLFGHGFSLSKQLFEAVGGFDEKFQGWGHEDIDLGYRLFVHSGRRSGFIRLKSEAYGFHVPHFSNLPGNRQTAGENARYFRSKHRRYDIEVFSTAPPRQASSKISRYEEGIGSFVSHGLGRLPAGLADLADEGAAVLLLATDTGDLDWPGGRLRRYDHSRPESAANPHLLGLVTALGDAELDAVVNVDLWRILDPTDLNLHVVEALRVAPRLVLVQNPQRSSLAPGPDVSYLARMLERGYRVQSRQIGAAVALEVSRPAA